MQRTLRITEEEEEISVLLVEPGDTFERIDAEVGGWLSYQQADSTTGNIEHYATFEDLIEYADRYEIVFVSETVVVPKITGIDTRLTEYRRRYTA